MSVTYKVYAELSGDSGSYHDYTQADVDNGVILTTVTDSSVWQVVAVKRRK